MSTKRRAVDVIIDEDPRHRPPLILGKQDFASITDIVCRPVETEVKKTPRTWLVLFSISSFFLAILGAMILYLFFTGVGVWGLNNPVGWGFDITNFVFWVGIGHAGTLISAILYLFR